MTIVGVSATKISSMDVLIAGNDQKKMILNQSLDSRLPQYASIEVLEKTFTKTGFTPSEGETNKYIFAQTTSEDFKVDIEVIDLAYSYDCKREGKASDIGPDAPACDLYDFHVSLKSMGSSAKNTRHQGSGKMVPRKQHADDVTNGVYSFEN